MHVLIAEDDDVTVDLLEAALTEFGYEVSVACDGIDALRQIRTGKFQLVISDWEMPGMNGLELCRRVRQRRWSSYIYFILLTSHSGVDNVVQGLDAGADDFLTKPFYPQELRVRLSVGRRILGMQSRDLTIFALAKLAESRDSETGAHLERIREYCRLLGMEMGRSSVYRDQIDGDFVELLYLTSPLHDIGKVGIPDQVLLKPGKLTPQEFTIMQQHTIIGANTLDAVARVNPGAQFLVMARDIALSHHERFDGTGYPQKICEQHIPLSGRITAIADVYDALTSKRVYKPAFSHETAIEMIVSGSGTQFDPAVVSAFLELVDDFDLIRKRFNNVSSVFDGERLNDSSFLPIDPLSTPMPPPAG